MLFEMFNVFMRFVVLFVYINYSIFIFENSVK